jgi:hypothetical protein
MSLSAPIINTIGIPQPLKLLKHWVLWRLEEREERKTKVPYTPNGRMASSTDPAEWSTFKEVASRAHNYSGIGFVFTDKDPYVGIDLDKCFAENGTLKPWAQKISDELGSYQELSPSGKGLHIILEEPSLFAGRKVPIKNSETGEVIECYSQGRYFTVTGNVYEDHDKLTKYANFAAWHAENFPPKESPRVVASADSEPQELSSAGLSDEEVLEECASRRNKEKFALLYNLGDWAACKFGSHSDADLSLVNMLLTVSRDVAQTDKLYRTSKLMRGKWDEYRGEKTYGAMTLEKARKSLLERTQTNGVSKSKDGDEKGSVATKVVKSILSDPSIQLFTDLNDNPYISVEIGTHREQWTITSGKFRSWLIRRHLQGEDKVLNPADTASIVNSIKAYAEVSGMKIKLSARTAYVDGVLWYDLCDPEWRAVKITKDGWSIENEPPLVFKRLLHQNQQTEPLYGGDVDELWEFLNVQTKDQRMLYLAWLISAFIPNTPRPIAYIYGPQGSAKSTLSHFTRLLLDPAKLCVTSMPEKHDEIAQQLAHSPITFYDNVSKISAEVSDLLCKAITGSSFAKRQLYTDEDDIIFQVFTCVGINGINNVAIKPDLLERCLLFQLERPSEANRKEDSVQKAKFEVRRPYILGAIFTILSKALALHSDIKLTSFPRMADFARWGTAITQAHGESVDEFLRVLSADTENKSGAVLASHPIAGLLDRFIESKKEWVGTVTELKAALRLFTSNGDTFSIYKDCGLNTPPNVLSRTLNTLKPVLEDEGILIQSDTPKAQMITITRVKRKWGENDPHEGVLTPALQNRWGGRGLSDNRDM